MFAGYQRFRDEKSDQRIQKKFRREAFINLHFNTEEIPFTDQRLAFYLGLKALWADADLRLKMKKIIVALNAKQSLPINCDAIIKRLVEIGILVEKPSDDRVNHGLSFLSNCCQTIQTEKTILDPDFLRFVFYPINPCVGLEEVNINMAELKVVTTSENCIESVTSLPEPKKKSTCVIL